jgi:NitT/TauT family transport system substrate-binding protein
VKNIIFALLIMFSSGSCFASSYKDELKISTNSWIGYAPVFYAYAKGELKDLNIKLITNLTLSEASDVFRAKKADIVTTTQHEYYKLKKSFPDIVPIITIDRSYGGDMIFSNKDIKSLKKAQKIYVYLEKDSINKEVFDVFAKDNSFDRKKIVLIYRDQKKMSSVKNEKNKAIVIVTFIPYNFAIQQNGFKEIASSKDIDTLLVIDSLCADKSLLLKDGARLKKFKKIIDDSIVKIKKETKATYEVVAPYLGDMSYKEYLDALGTIKWINHPSKKLLKYMQKLGYQEKYLVK